MAFGRPPRHDTIPQAIRTTPHISPTMIIVMIRRFIGASRRSARFMVQECRLWFRAFLQALPGETGCLFRRWFYGFKSAPRACIRSGVIIYNPEGLHLGRNSRINNCCKLNAGGGIVIGDHVSIGPGTAIWSQNHKYESKNELIRNQGYERRIVTIEDDVWIGACAIVLPGVCIARGTVVAAGSVVTKSTDPYSVVAGVPARPISKRGEHMRND